MTEPSRNATPDPRTGPLGRITATVYWFLVVEGCFLLAAMPGFVLLFLLSRDSSNIPLVMLALVPVMPAFSAAMATLHRRSTADELVVWPVYWKQWWSNLGDVCRIWIPALVLLGILAINIVVGPDAGLPTWVLVACLTLAIGVMLWVVLATVIATFFHFRTRDIARLGVFYLASKPLVTLGVASFLLIVGALIAFTSDWLAALAGSLLAAFLLVTVRPMLDDVRKRFIDEEDPGTEPEADPEA